MTGLSALSGDMERWQGSENDLRALCGRRRTRDYNSSGDDDDSGVFCWNDGTDPDQTPPPLRRCGTWP